MNELSLVKELVKLMRFHLPGFVIFRIEEKVVSGIPDIIITGNGKTSFIECKFGNPDFKSKGLQEYNMNKLAVGGSAFYVVYILDNIDRRWTYIVSPKDIGLVPGQWSLYENGFSHKFVIDYVKEIHDHNG